MAGHEPSNDREGVRLTVPGRSICGPARQIRQAARPAAKKAEPKRAPEARPAPEPEAKKSSPVVEDIQDDWNGPLPSFLSQSAG